MESVFKLGDESLNLLLAEVDNPSTWGVFLVSSRGTRNSHEKSHKLKTDSFSWVPPQEICMSDSCFRSTKNH